jgi:hypothetical protein
MENESAYRPVIAFIPVAFRVLRYYALCYRKLKENPLICRPHLDLRLTDQVREALR